MTEREKILYDALSQVVAVFSSPVHRDRLDAISHAEIVLAAFYLEEVKT